MLNLSLSVTRVSLKQKTRAIKAASLKKFVYKEVKVTNKFLLQIRALELVDYTKLGIKVVILGLVSHSSFWPLEAT